MTLSGQANPMGTQSELRLDRVSRRIDWRRRRFDRLVSIGLAVWVLIYFDFGGLLRIGARSRTATSYVEYVGEAIRSGSTRNQILVLSLASIGSYYLPSAWRWLRKARTLPLVLLFAYGVWSLLSLSWSVDAQLTERRVTEMFLIAIGCVGIGAGFYGSRPDGRRRFIRDALVIGALGCLVWIPALLSGNVNFLSPDWSLTRVGIGDRFGIPVAYGLIAALVARFRFSSFGYFRPRHLSIYIAVMAITLIALRKRTLLAGVLIACVVALLILAGKTRRRRWTTGIVVAGAVGLVMSLSVGINPFESLAPVITRGEQIETLTSLTGRVPLWNELIGGYLSERPFIGYGFGAFWRPEVIEGVWEVIGWPATSAHNGVLEEALATGLVGTVLLVSIWVAIVTGSLRTVFGEGHDSYGLIVAAWSFLLAFTSLSVASLQLWGELSLMMPITAFAAVIIWEVRESHDPDLGLTRGKDVVDQLGSSTAQHAPRPGDY